MYGTVQKLFELGPESFDPPPKVRSAVFRMKMQPRFAELQVDEAGFIGFLEGDVRAEAKNREQQSETGLR